MSNELYINLGFIGHKAESLQNLFGNYSKEPNRYGRFLKFENYSELVCNQGVMCYTNCFENEEHFKEMLNAKLLDYFLEKNLVESNKVLSL